MTGRFSAQDETWMREALVLARKGWGFTSPNPCVGAVLVRSGNVIGSGWHRRAGAPHAEIAALRDADKKGNATRGATLYVTLEPCSTTGRTGPCTEAILAAGLRRVVVAATDPNPKHRGRGLRWLKRNGIDVRSGLLAAEATRLNEGFNHWIVHRTPFVTLKAAMTLDGRIATATGDSRWITGKKARDHAMNHLRRGADAILVGINTVLADDPGLTYRGPGAKRKKWWRVVLDSNARTPPNAKLVSDEFKAQTVIVVAEKAPAKRVRALEKNVMVWKLPTHDGRIELSALLTRLGAAGVTNLLVEGGGETNGTFLQQGVAHRAAFYYAPKILGGRGSRPGIGGDDPATLSEAAVLHQTELVNLGADWLVTGLIARPENA